MKARGLTLVEVIVCMGILVVLTGMLVMIYSSSYANFRRGTSRMAVQQRAREVLRRATPLIMSAKAPNDLEEAILLPDLGETGEVLEFFTADNLLLPMEAVNPRAPVHFMFRLSLQADGAVRFERLDPVSHLPTGDFKILAHNVESMKFERLAVNLVDLRIKTADTIRNAANQEEQLVVERSAVIAVPFYSGTR